jgi:Flp pilus assembly protein TadD
LALIEAKEIDAAIADFDQVIAITPDNAGAYLKRGNAYHRKGRIEGARYDYQKALSLADNSAANAALKAQIEELIRETSDQQNPAST